MNILSIVGAHPKFIKYAPPSHKQRKVYQEILVHKGKHYDHDISKAKRPSVLGAGECQDRRVWAWDAWMGRGSQGIS